MILALDFLKNMNNHTDISINACVKGIGAFDGQISGEGLNEFMHFAMKAVMMPYLKRKIEYINE